jgi:hemerythrin superfamily protein
VTAQPDDGGHPPERTSAGQHLIEVHNHLRQQLNQIRGLIGEVASGAIMLGEARSAINDMSIRRHDRSFRGFCAAYSQLVTTHHSLEDAVLFPHLRRSDSDLKPIIDRLANDHGAIHHLLNEFDQALVNALTDTDAITQLKDSVEALADSLLEHLAFEEDVLFEPLARYGFGLR